MKKMGLFWFAAALLGAALIFAGCETEAETETKYVNVDVPVFGFTPPDDAVTASNIYLLQDLLATTSVYDHIIYAEAPSAAITVPDGKTLYLDASDDIDLTSAGAITVTGKLVVYNGTFTPGTKVTGAGTLEVEAFGELVVTDAALFTGTTKVSVTKYALLDASGATVSTEAAIKSWVGYAGEGALSLTVTILTPSVTLEAIGTRNVTYYSGFPAGGVIVENNVLPTETSLTIPAGVSLTTTNALAAVTSLTVNGGLNASGATGATAGVTITLGNNGYADLGVVKLAANVTVPAGAQFSIGDTSDFAAHTVTYKAGGRDLISDIDLTFSAVSSDGWTLDDNTTLAAGENIVIPASVIVPVGVTLENNGTITLESGAGLVLAGTVSSAATAGAKLKGTGSLKAGATTITGEWQALGAADTTVTIAATGAATSSIEASATTVALTASAAGATITQAAGTGNNLTIAADTTIALGGTTTKLGEIVLVKDATNPGKLSFAATGAQITTGVTTGTALTGAGGVFVAVANDGADTLGVSAFETTNHVVITGDNDSLKSIVWGNGTAYIIGPKSASGNDGTISSTTDCTG
jgi:hypothetical protein